jgi:hypothetical protein
MFVSSNSPVQVATLPYASQKAAPIMKSDGGGKPFGCWSIRSR